MSDEVFERLGLTEYERTALTELLSLGRTTAPNLAEATGIPKARIYGVLDSLADEGYVKVIPGRPKQYVPRSPAEILDRAEENRRQAYERFVSDLEDEREAFLAEFGPRFEHAEESATPAEELFHVVDVGEPSEGETRRIYHAADERVRVLTKAFEYIDSVEEALADAVDRDLDVRVVMRHPDALTPENRERQRAVVERLDREFPAVGVRFSREALPFRGTLADPTMEYDDGTAILLVQEDDVPNHLRQAVITENGAFVAGLNRYFDLVWTHESESDV
ncbi:TrmB family transcriptional regulator [Halomarina ordinaria]|uniref:TrmB family transcriptional regulator n=1 Tax=Halomarina ordinaria TaxID=3033939 RepID=A0ABD5U912_9EURY|nr:helix-turn-helix domain-containing protein [Halomarina sp. PSRA2]